MITPLSSGTGGCPHCGIFHLQRCPRIKAIEYHDNGAVKRVEFHVPAEIRSTPQPSVPAGVTLPQIDYCGYPLAPPVWWKS